MTCNLKTWKARVSWNMAGDGLSRDRVSPGKALELFALRASSARILREPHNALSSHYPPNGSVARARRSPNGFLVGHTAHAAARTPHSHCCRRRHSPRCWLPLSSFRYAFDLHFPAPDTPIADTATMCSWREKLRHRRCQTGGDVGSHEAHGRRHAEAQGDAKRVHHAEGEP